MLKSDPHPTLSISLGRRHPGHFSNKDFSCVHETPLFLNQKLVHPTDPDRRKKMDAFEISEILGRFCQIQILEI